MSLPVVDAIFNTLQTASIWTANTTGFNFAWTFNVATYPAFADAGEYEVVFTIQPTSGQAVIVRYQITAF